MSENTSAAPVISALTGGVLTLTLDAPEKRNALNSSLVGGLLAGLQRAADDLDVRAVVLTHTGGTFCAGADLGEALARGASVAEANAEGTRAMVEVMRTMVELPKPVIVVIDGHVRAGGFGLVGAADIAFAGPAATFALTESRLGLAPAVVSLVLLPTMTRRSVGRYVLTGERFGPATAVAAGLVTAAAETSGDLDALLADVLSGVRKASPQGLAASKAVATERVREVIDRDATQRCDLSAELFSSAEAREGMAAFLSKRPPSWDLVAGADR